MISSVSWSPTPSLNVVSVQQGEQAWTVTVDSRQPTYCPGCGTQSKSRHSAYSRTLRDLSAQGAPVIISARLARWRCRNQRCDRRIFTERLPGLERRQVVDLLADRSAATTAGWFKDHPEVEVVSRDRAGLYADATRQGAPQARQVADRFHLLQNFCETVERQLGRFEAPISDSQVNARDNQATPPLPARSDCASDAVRQKRLMCRGRQAVRQELFDADQGTF